MKCDDLMILAMMLLGILAIIIIVACAREM